MHACMLVKFASFLPLTEAPTIYQVADKQIQVDFLGFLLINVRINFFPEKSPVSHLYIISALYKTTLTTAPLSNLFILGEASCICICQVLESS